MDFSRGKKPDLYSTVVIHDSGGSSDEDPSSLPPLLQRLPKDFDAAESPDSDTDSVSASISGTFIVKKDRSATANDSMSSPRRSLRSPFDDLRRDSPRARSEMSGDSMEEASVSGTFVRRTCGGGGGFGSPSMSEAVESMRSGGGREERQQQQQQQQARRKASVSSVPESITKEDPTTKYELLHELGVLLLAAAFLSGLRRKGGRGWDGGVCVLGRGKGGRAWKSGIGDEGHDRSRAMLREQRKPQWVVVQGDAG